MAAAIMTGALPTGHKTHTDPPAFPAYVTVLFSFGFRHLASPSSSLCQFISKNISRKERLRRHRCRDNEYSALFPIEDLDIHDGMARKSERASILKRRAELTLIGNREGSLPYELTPWQIRADGGLWIDIPHSMLRFDGISRLAIQVTEFDCQVVGILGINMGSIF